MASSVAAPAQPAEPRSGPARRGRPTSGLLRDRSRQVLALPSLVALANGIAFVILRPGVNDLWAARARASAARNGVGLTYWFSWFGGGATPGNYSVLTPYLCAYIGTEVVGALSALAVTVLATVLVRGTRHPLTASALAAVTAGINLWSGRVPFLLGAAFGAAAIIAVRHRHRVGTVVWTVLSMLASPVSGVFVAVGLSGTFLTTRTREWRPIIAWAVVTVGVAGLATALAFGTPGPEPFHGLIVTQALGGLVILWIARPPDHLRTTIYVSMALLAPLYAIPNGLGSNFTRFVWFCLPVAVVATSRRRAWVLALMMVPLIVVSGATTVNDLEDATKPISSTSYYSSLSRELDTIGNLRDYRLEVVDHGAHAGYDALLGHASLARGWETQEDTALNASLNQNPLPPVTYKLWLDDNAVGYVALPAAKVGAYPEYTLVRSDDAPYLHLMWSDSRWRLYRVSDPTPIIEPPARIVSITQSVMTVRVPCACSVEVRLHFSKFLVAALVPPVRTASASPSPSRSPSASASGPGPGSGSASPPAQPTVTAQILNDGTGWTVLRTPRAGTYQLSGSITGIAR